MDKINKTYTAPQAVFEPCDPAHYLMAGSDATVSGNPTDPCTGDCGDDGDPNEEFARRAVPFGNHTNFEFTLDDF